MEWYDNSGSFEDYITYDDDGGDDCKGCERLSACRNGTNTKGCVWDEVTTSVNPYLDYDNYARR